ncbi:ABC transporter ATP-binding protein [Natranaerofaba carboxydovora]|uniref:ABC transporter ATP-binding protein n=1 Tax=Natranaerofaba carboxydovora TaxID=2742683 RepID=UPI001F13749E|nr:ABC transporter ATP-binding protein [Natranaerofaba carboxydovora]UMZ73440.1 Glutathione import ATP-binding protein GsiA [Natranaerofaba carboxydovora]
MLTINDLSIKYLFDDNEIKAVNKVTFSLEPGESVGIIGETGSGKSTLAHSLLDLISAPHEKQGEIIIDQKNIFDLPAKEINELRWSTAAIVFQNSLEVLNPVMKIGDQVIEPLRKKSSLSKAEEEKELLKLFDMVDLDIKWKDAYPHQLSGGMRQRMLLAMALSCKPKLLILDEPTSSLDAISREKLQNLLKNLQNELGFSMLVISHEIGTITKLTDKLMIMYQGEMVEKGVTDEILDYPAHPYSRGLINSSVEVFPYKDLWGIPGEPEIGVKVSKKEKCLFSSRCTQMIEKCKNERPTHQKISLNREVLCHQGGITDVLKAKELWKSFELGNSSVSAVAGVDISLKHGETAALLGPSGSGKSTLAHLLCGFIPHDEGKIEFLNKEVNGNWVVKEEGGIQLILQDPYSSISHRLTVYEAVTEPLYINKIGDPTERTDRCKKVLSSVQLPSDDEFLDRWCSSLSGGQRQRLAIARGLIMKPKVLIADEITSMLDVSTQANIMRLLKGLQNKEGFSLLYITHDLQLARKVAEKIYVLDEGKVIEEGSATKVFENTSCCKTKEFIEAGLLEIS